MGIRLSFVLVLCLMAVPRIPTLRAEQPATVPAAQLDAMKRTWIGLDDPDPGVREKSRQKLFSITKDELPALKATLEFFWPLDASQVALAKDVVTHVYLCGESYDHSDEGFLGTRMSQEAGEAVVIESRLPGFCAYGLLQNGDAILDIEERPLRQPAQRVEFMAVVKAFAPGTVVHLKVQRNGQELRIAVRLDARPVDREGLVAGIFDIEPLLGRRGGEAEKYWKETFAPAVGEKEKVSGAAARAVN